MPTFLVEGYAGELRKDACAELAERARSAARELTARGTFVRHLQSIFVPEDETCFHLFEAARADDVAEVSAHAALSAARIVETA